MSKKRYYKLDDFGRIGYQTTHSAASRKYHSAKTAAIFKKFRRLDSLIDTALEEVKQGQVRKHEDVMKDLRKRYS